MGKLKSIFELTENLSLVLTKLDTELGLAQPQLVNSVNSLPIWQKLSVVSLLSSRVQLIV